MVEQAKRELSRLRAELMSQVKSVGEIAERMNALFVELAEDSARHALGNGDFRRFVEIADEGIWVIDGEGRTSYVNAKMAEMLGYSVSEVMGRPLFELMDADA